MARSRGTGRLRLQAGFVGGEPVVAEALQRLLWGLEGTGWGNWREVVISGIALDSRRVEPGDLFVALPGQHSHGRRYLADAVRRGAVAILTGQEGWVFDGSPPLPGFAANSPRRALAVASARLWGEPARDLILTGVTGTNGKTTVVYLIAQILEAAGWPAGYWSTAEVRGSAQVFRPLMTTPEAPELHRFLAEVRARGIRHAVMEVSSHAVVLERIATLQFHTAVVTNLSPDHLDFHRSFANYRAAKEALVAGLPQGGVAVLNQDDPEVRTFAVPASVRTIRYGVQTQAELTAIQLEADDTQSRFELLVSGWLGEEVPAGGRGPHPVCLSLPGRHNVYNALAAVGAALSLGVPVQTATAALARAKPPVRRLEAYREGPYTVVNDVAMNRASYDAVLETMRRWGKPLVVVNALRGNRGEQVNRDIALALAEWDRRLRFAPLIVTLSESQLLHLAADYRVRPEELQSFLEVAREQGLAVECFRELPEAIARGVERLQPGGILLLLGTFGMDDGAALARQVLRQRLGYT